MAVTFQIYKYSDERIEDFKELNLEEHHQEEINEESILSAVIEFSVSQLLKKMNSNEQYLGVQEIMKKDKGIQGIYFETSRKTAWKEDLEQLINESSSTKLNVSNNISISYILFIPINTTIFIMTGGNGSKHIKSYIDASFGIDLIPKIIKSNESIIKSFSQSNVAGNRQEQYILNRSHTNINSEKEMNSLIKNLNIELNSQEIKETLGLPANSTKSLKLENKDSLKINENLSFEEIFESLIRIENINNREANFAMNYLIPAKNKGIKITQIDELLITSIIEKEELKLSLSVSDKLFNNFDVKKIVITNSEGKCFALFNHSEISLKEFFSNVEQQLEEEDFIDQNHKISLGNRAHIKRILKNWEINFISSDNEIIDSNSVYNLLNGSYTLNNNGREIELYIFAGHWYMFNDKYSNDLKVAYEEFYDTNEELILNIGALQPLMLPYGEDTKNEEEYLKTIRSKELDNYIVPHTVLMNNVEFADIITWDDDNFYIISKKSHFNGEGVRDLSNQMHSAASYFSQLKNARDTEELENYFNKIQEKYKKYDVKFNYSVEQFKEKLKNNLIMVAGYINDYEKDTGSLYAKFLTLNLKSTLKNDYDIDFYVMRSTK